MGTEGKARALRELSKSLVGECPNCKEARRAAFKRAAEIADGFNFKILDDGVNDTVKRIAKLIRAEAEKP